MCRVVGVYMCLCVVWVCKFSSMGEVCTCACVRCICCVLQLFVAVLCVLCVLCHYSVCACIEYAHASVPHKCPKVLCVHMWGYMYIYRVCVRM